MKAMVEADESGEQTGDHQNTEPAHIKAVVSAGDPAAKPFPAIGAFASLVEL